MSQLTKFSFALAAALLGTGLYAQEQPQ